MKVVIIGGGIIGLCSAFYLQKNGHKVTVIDNKLPGEESTSTGNAGMIVPSHFVPLAAPGMIQMGLKMLLNPKSPLGFHFPPSLDQLLWTWHFYKAATPQHVANSESILRDLNLFSRREYDTLSESLGIGMELRKDGLLMLCQKQSTLDHEAKLAQRANEIGLHADVISRDQLKSLDPNIDYSVTGAVHFKDDASISPTSFLSSLRDQLANNGVEFAPLQTPTGFGRTNGKIDRVHTERGTYECDELVVATGAWTGNFIKSLGLKLPILAGRGYGFTLHKPVQTPGICAILTEARVAMTPMVDGLRFTGTMELGPPSDHVNPSRVDGIIEGIPKFIPAFTDADLRGEPIWAGNRPCSPDGLPYLGKISGNVTVATGHGMMGLSLGPITGKLVSQVVSSQPTDLPLEQLKPDRYA